MFRVSRAKRANAEKRETGALLEYVSAGTAMLADGDSVGARDHFTNSPNWEGQVNVKDRAGAFKFIHELLSREDLVRSTTFLASNSSAQPHFGKMGTVVMAECSIGAVPLSARQDGGNAAASSELVEELRHEAAVIAAEEWLHLVQARTGQPLAGILAREADVAAHFDGLGIELSTDFLTRYPERAAWGAESQPGRADEITDFGQSHELRFAPGPRAGGVTA
ncbi:MAG TPA: hypothetical protein VFX79_02680 [Candidatus Saccharimonadales bacterium]|nr:hypothetical protein [Candidatus Saccharimonadales bacterium]